MRFDPAPTRLNTSRCEYRRSSSDRRNAVGSFIAIAVCLVSMIRIIDQIIKTIDKIIKCLDKEIKIMKRIERSYPLMRKIW